MSDASARSYDDVPYESHPVLPTHPGNLAAVATLAGMRPPAVARCRVLELGCASGGNLIPLAVVLPESRFVGIDLSPRQVAAGRGVIEALGLTNVRLEPQSILDLDEDAGAFDYVICHGVYSWVSAEVQARILALCARHLTPDGVAYVSYNTYPGWHLRGMVRDMMLFHARGFATPQERVGQARSLLDFLMTSARGTGSAYAAILKDEARLVQEVPDSYLLHDHLEEVNHPLYFHQFVERAGAHDLQYLGEAIPTAIHPGEFSAEVEETVRRLARDAIEFEQYLDFLRNRTFRRTLLCHAGVSLDRSFSAHRVTALCAASAAAPLHPTPDVRSDAVAQFSSPGGPMVSSTHPWVKAMLVCLGERWPEAVAFDALRRLVEARLAVSLSAEDVRQLGDALLGCYVSGVIELHAHAAGFARQAGDRPRASPLARLQAAAGGVRVTSLNHRVVELSALDRHVVRLLDGTRDRAALVEALAAVVAGEQLALQYDGEPRHGAADDRGVLRAALEQSLAALGRAAILLG